MRAPASAVENRFHACSACGGDYEDPERTAWSEDAEEESDQQDERDSRLAPPDEFPVQCD